MTDPATSGQGTEGENLPPKNKLVTGDEILPVKSVLVTGDEILDHQIYMGERTSHDSQREVGSKHRQDRGGAFLVYNLVYPLLWQAASDWLKEKLEETEKELEKSTKEEAEGFSQEQKAKTEKRIASISDRIEQLKQQPRSGAAADADPGTQFPVYFDLKKPEELPPHLNGYAIWRPVRQAPRSNDFVWRVEKPLGYGRRADEACLFAGERKVHKSKRPDIVVIDDAGLGIRFDKKAKKDNEDKKAKKDNKAWPEALEKPKSVEWVVLKMARPLAHGALWDKLRDFEDKLIIIVSIDDIRRAPVRVTKGISWERTALDLADELNSNADIKALLKCRHLIINMRSEGALLVNGDSHDRQKFTLIFNPEHLEGEWESSYEGTVFGLTSGLTAAVVNELARPRKKDEQPDLELGIKSGLAGVRSLFFEGHGRANAETPGPKLDLFAREVLSPTVAYQSATLPDPEELALSVNPIGPSLRMRREGSVVGNDPSMGSPRASRSPEPRHSYTCPTGGSGRF